MEAKGLDLSYIITVIRSRLRKCVESASSCWNGWVERNSSEGVTASWHSSQACQADFFTFTSDLYLYQRRRCVAATERMKGREGTWLLLTKGSTYPVDADERKASTHTKRNPDIPAHCPSLLSDHRTFPQVLPPSPCQQSSQELWLRHHCGKHEAGEQRFAYQPPRDCS